jgi:phosphoenolpyruvate carboxykinase (GTP)
MAMRPFVGYNMGDYFKHWIEMGKKVTNKPQIFNVNWFRTDDEGNFIWPGFGDNMRVLEWIIDRCEGKVDAQETAIGYIPNAEDINVEGLEDVTLDTIKELLTIDKENWIKEAEGIEQFYGELTRVPQELKDELAILKANLAK